MNYCSFHFVSEKLKLLATPILQSVFMFILGLFFLADAGWMAVQWLWLSPLIQVVAGSPGGLSVWSLHVVVMIHAWVSSKYSDSLPQIQKHASQVNC